MIRIRHEIAWRAIRQCSCNCVARSRRDCGRIRPRRSRANAERECGHTSHDKHGEHIERQQCPVDVLKRRHNNRLCICHANGGKFMQESPPDPRYEYLRRSGGTQIGTFQVGTKGTPTTANQKTSATEKSWNRLLEKGFLTSCPSAVASAPGWGLDRRASGYTLRYS